MNALYRGKRIDTGEWVYGLPHKDGYLTLIISEDIESWDTDYINPEWWWKVDPATVGQYTGLDDKNGVKIFAGDIIRDDEGHEAIVRWCDGKERHHEYGFRLFWEKDKELRKNLPFWVNYQSIEVIGNIHDKEASE